MAVDRRSRPTTPQPDGRRATDNPNAPGRSLGLTPRKRIEMLSGQLTLDRASFLTTWQELADYLSPRRIRRVTSDRNKGDRRTQNIIDSTPRQAVRTLAAGMHGGITSPARPWFRLTTPDPTLGDFSPVRQWLHLVSSRLHTMFLRSNLYNSLPITYEDIGVFGTSAMCLLEDGKDLMRTYAYPVGSYAIGLDSRGVASTFMREYELTVRRVVEEFLMVDNDPRQIDWSRCSRAVKQLWEHGNTETAVPVTWMVYPNPDYDPTRLESKWTMRWRSCYFETGNETIKEPHSGFLRESGFRVFPILAPRWSITGEDSYGTDCPGMTALGDVKSLQFMAKKGAKAVDKAVDPPLTAPASMKTEKVSLIGGEVSYEPEDGRSSGPRIKPIHEIRLEGLQFLNQERIDMRQRVNEAFYVDLFRMLAQSDMVRGSQPVTAEEIRARQEEKLVALGPVLERLNDELLDPLIDRAFDILLAAGGIPEPPEELQGVDLKVEYVSIMAQAQKLVGVVGQDRFMSSMIAASETFPVLKHKVNPLQWAEDMRDQLGVNPSQVHSNEEALASFQAEQEAAAQLQRADVLKAGAQAAQALGQTPTQGGSSTALDDLGGAAV